MWKRTKRQKDCGVVPANTSCDNTFILYPTELWRHTTTTADFAYHINKSKRIAKTKTEIDMEIVESFFKAKRKQ